MHDGSDYYPWSDWIKIQENAELAREDYTKAMNKYNQDRAKRAGSQSYFQTAGIIRTFQR